MRLYRPRNPAERLRVVGMVSKMDIRKWLEDHPGGDGDADVDI